MKSINVSDKFNSFFGEYVVKTDMKRV